ncbi:hypothetical protein L6R52_26860 [Myxococcota bacterium]|nr:hypothetical protein [Myxococcota bacterium]
MAAVSTGGRRGADRALLIIEALAGIAVVAAIVGKAGGVAPTVFFVLTAVSVAYTGWVVIRAAAAWGDDTLDVVGKVRDSDREHLEQEKLILLQGIKELEADAAVGKVDARDYEYLRKTAEQRALTIIERIRDDDTKWMREAEALVRAKLGPARGVEGAALAASAAAAVAPAPVVAAAPVASAPVTIKGAVADARLFDDRAVVLSIVDGVAVCSACSAKSDADARFCTGCGRPREERRA